MLCSVCKQKLIVTESRSSDDFVYRERKCPNCGKIIYTEEYESADVDEVRRQIWSIHNNRRRKDKK